MSDFSFDRVPISTGRHARYRLDVQWQGMLFGAFYLTRKSGRGYNISTLGRWWGVASTLKSAEDTIRRYVERLVSELDADDRELLDKHARTHSATHKEN